MEEMGMIVKIFIGILLIGISGFLLITVSDDFSNWITKLFRGDIENEVTQMCQQSQHVLFESGDISKEEFVKAAESVGWWVWKNDKPCVLEATVEDELTDDEIADPITKAVGSRFEAVGDDCLFTLEPIGGNDFTGDNALVFVKKEGLEHSECKSKVFAKAVGTATLVTIITGGTGLAFMGSVSLGTVEIATLYGLEMVGLGTLGSFIIPSFTTFDTLIISKKSNACRDWLGPNYMNFAKTGNPDPELKNICTGNLEIPSIFCSKSNWADICEDLPVPKEIPCNSNDFWRNKCKEFGKVETDKVTTDKIKLGFISSDEFLIYKLGLCFEVFNKLDYTKHPVIPCFAEIYTFKLDKELTLTEFYSRIREILQKGETTKKFNANNLEACDWPEGNYPATEFTNCIYTEMNGQRLKANDKLTPNYYSTQIFHYDDYGKNDMAVVMTTTIQDIFELKPPQ